MEEKTKMFDIMNLDGQRVVIERNKFLYMHIREGPFLSAAQIKGWQKNAPALGVNISILNLARFKDWRIRIFVKDRFDRCYETHPEIFFEFQKSFDNSYKVGKTELLLLPWTNLYFETIKDFPKEVINMLVKK
ncbi:MAG: hypothetical protein QXU09_03710 [Thermoproteota archaeon]